MKDFFRKNRLFFGVAVVLLLVSFFVKIVFSKENWSGSIVYEGMTGVKEFLNSLGGNTILNYFIVGFLIVLAIIILATLFTKISDSNSEMSDVKKLSLVGIFSALAYIFMFFGIPFILPFLKVEISVVIIILVMSFVDYKSGILIALIISVLDFLVKGSAVGYPIDQFAYFIAAFFFITPIFFIKRKTKTNKGIAVGLITSTLITTVIMVILNYIWILPVYIKLYGLDSITQYANAVDVNLGSANQEFIWVAVTFGAFNLVKWGIVAVIGYISLRTTGPLIKSLSK
ncbi:ECF transporter S component [Mycoplasmatota bacterium]|nr:ECF transporter S component [Mycoplasmatota bacterium]